VIFDFLWKEKQEAVNSEEGGSFSASPDGNSEIDKDNAIPRSQMHFSAAKVFSDRYPEFFADSNYTRSKSESRIVLSMLTVLTLLVIAAWVIWDARYFNTDGNVVYYMGLTGGLLLLFTLLYALRKRAKIFKNFGKLSTWYYIHLTSGVIGPILIIFHSSFKLKAMNSTVAMIAMLCVIASGIFGRYIYTRIGYHLHRQLIAIRTTENRLLQSMQRYSENEMGEVEKNISVLTASAISTPKNIHHLPARFFSLRAKAAKCYIEGAREITSLLKKHAAKENWDKSTYQTELAREKRYLREHVNALVEIGQSHFYERLLVGWRIFHIPLIFILVISGSVHVLAVHLY
jgi:hypothetical protein